MIVGLVGFIGAGKGTVGDLLRLQGFKQMSFAGILKDTASVMFGWDRELLEGDTPESREFREQKDNFWSDKFGYDFSPRLALQLLGTEAGRNVFHKDIWVFALEKRIKQHKNVVITDTRFPNEIQWIRDQGGIIVEVSRGDLPEWYETAYNENNDPDNHNGDMNTYWPNIHHSEWAWIGQQIDYNIKNDGSLNDLKRSVDSMFNYEGVTNEVV